MSEWLIETKSVTRTYGKRVVVNDVNLRVKRGEIYGFLGPNGAGKTTTIRMLLGLIKPTEGDVRLFGKELHKNRIEVLRRVGSLVESPSYYGHLSGYDNLEALRRLLGVEKKRIDEVLEVVRLTKDAKRPVKGYSLGMKQRLGIAAALLGEPELIILDEPTNGLDPAGIQEIRELIRRMPEEYGVTVLVSSHLLGEIDQMATQVGIISEGKLIFQDDIDVLRRRSQARVKFRVENPGQAQAFLRGIGVEAALEDGVLWIDEQAGRTAFRGRELAAGRAADPALVSGLDDHLIGEINRHLIANGHAVYRIEEVKRSLEDIFLELTGKGASL